MTVEAKAQAVMAANAALTALVPATKIRTPGPWQNVGTPFIVHHPVVMEAFHTFERIDASGLRRYEFYQVDVFTSGSGAYLAGKNIVNAVYAALGGRHGKFVFQATEGAIYVGTEPVGDNANEQVEHFAAHFNVSGHED